MNNTVTKVKVRNRHLWQVRWHEFGRVRRKFFTGRTSADAHAAYLNGEKITARQRLQLLDESEAMTLIAAHDEAQRRGVNIYSAVMAALPEKPSPAIADVIAEICASKRSAKRAESYVYRLEKIANSFCQGRERLPIADFKFEDIQRFMAKHSVNYRSTLRSKLSTLFKYAVRHGYRSDNPCERLEAISITHKSPEVLTVDEAKKCLRWLAKKPRLFGWFALSTFAGLRPDEAMKTTWQEINFAEGWIRVEAQTTKVRQRRVVYPLPEAMKLIRLAKDKGAELPLTIGKLIQDRDELKTAIGWQEWKYDVTRHTAASYWLASVGDAGKVAMMLGHSESILRKNYMALVTKADAERFWAISPPF